MAKKHIAQKDVDHINGDRSDDRISNLRDVDKAQNAMNRRSPRTAPDAMKGVYKKGEKWESSIGYYNKVKFLGTFNSQAEARAAYLEALKTYHGEFAKED